MTAEPEAENPRNRRTSADDAAACLYPVVPHTALPRFSRAAWEATMRAGNDLDLVDRIYEAAFIPEKWPEVFDGPSDLSNSAGASRPDDGELE